MPTTGCPALHLRPRARESHHDKENSKDPVQRERDPSQSPPMPATTKLILLFRAWAAASLLLILVLALHGRGGHCGGLSFDAEMEMDSEAHRRLLWEATTSRRYISYDALRGDVVPCSRTGVPYYNCRISTTANPYTRGCESITRCRDAGP